MIGSIGALVLLYEGTPAIHFYYGGTYIMGETHCCVSNCHRVSHAS